MSHQLTSSRHMVHPHNIEYHRPNLDSHYEVIREAVEKYINTNEVYIGRIVTHVSFPPMIRKSLSQATNALTSVTDNQICRSNSKISAVSSRVLKTEALLLDWAVLGKPGEQFSPEFLERSAQFIVVTENARCSSDKNCQGCYNRTLNYFRHSILRVVVERYFGRVWPLKKKQFLASISEHFKDQVSNVRYAWVESEINWIIWNLYHCRIDLGNPKSYDYGICNKTIELWVRYDEIRIRPRMLESSNLTENDKNFIKAVPKYKQFEEYDTIASFVGYKKELPFIDKAMKHVGEVVLAYADRVVMAAAVMPRFCVLSDKHWDEIRISSREAVVNRILWEEKDKDIVYPKYTWDAKICPEFKRIDIERLNL